METTDASPLDGLLAAYIADINTALAERGLTPSLHEWNGEDHEEGPGAVWFYGVGNASLSTFWPEGVSVIWTPGGWIDSVGNPLKLDTLGGPRIIAQAVAEHVSDAPDAEDDDEDERWHRADELETLLDEDAKERAEG